ncbi:MAG: efflux RND transporter permease subunit, partial [Actinomycetes bacterium]
EELANVTLQRAAGPPMRLGDLADVKEDHPPLVGDASNGGEQSLMLVVERFPDANTAQVSRDVEAALEAMAPGLTGITLDPTVYRPAAYLDSALDRLGLAVLIGLALMVAVIAVVALSWRVAAVTFVSVGVSLVGALWVLHLRDATLTTMTVIGLATVLALVVDDAVGDVADMRARFDRRRAEGDSLVKALASGALRERRNTLFYATVVVLVAAAPLLLLGGTAGAFARPALLTFVLAVLTSLVAALVVTPTLAVLLLGGQAGRPARAVPFAAGVNRGLDRLVAPSVTRKLPALATLAVLAAVVLGGAVAMRPGEMLPEPQDRNVLVRLQAAPGTALGEMNRITDRTAAELRTLRGVEAAGTHVGRAVGSDTVADVDASEIWLRIDGDADYAGTLEAVRATMDGYPGLRSTVQTYGQAQLAAASTPTGDDLVVRVYGQDFETLTQTAERVRDAMATVHGVISPTVESQPAQPVAEIHVDLPAAQRLGLQPGDVRRAASTLVSGLTVGNLYERQAIFDVVVWGGPASRQSVLDIQNIRIDTPSGAQVRLGEVARVEQTSDPTAITHHATSRSLDVTAQVQGRDLAEVAQDATARLQQLNYPYEYRAEVVETEDPSGVDALLLGGIVAAVLVFLLFQAATSSWRGAALLFVCAPLAGAGGIAAALLLGGEWNLAVLAAIFAVGALTVRQALLLVRRARGLLGQPGREGPAEAMLVALAEKGPALLAAVLATAAAFLPAAVMGSGAGLELLQPFAVTLLGGLLTTVVVVLFLVPALFPALGALAPAARGDGPDDTPDDDPGGDADRAPAHAAGHIPSARTEAARDRTQDPRTD